MIFETIEEARAFLRSTGFFFDAEDFDAETPEERKKAEQMLNLNDTFYWGGSDGEDVPDEDLMKLAILVRRYGRCGMLYYVSEKRNYEHTEFADINRFVNFVRNEERIIQEVPDYNERGYHKAIYTLGE